MVLSLQNVPEILLSESVAAAASSLDNFVQVISAFMFSPFICIQQQCLNIYVFDCRSIDIVHFSNRIPDNVIPLIYVRNK